MRNVVAEFVGTALLLATVVGSGIMADRLAGGNMAVALLANSLATGAGLVVLILTFGPVSGAHFNPVVTGAAVLSRALPWSTAFAYAAAQVTGAVAGVVVAHFMFDEPLLALSAHARSGWSQAGSELVATFGLVSVILSGLRTRPELVPLSVGAYITAAYWFTASTSFANPAVTLARTLTDTFTGIRPIDAPAFITAQLIGALAAVRFWDWLMPRKENT